MSNFNNISENEILDNEDTNKKKKIRNLIIGIILSAVVVAGVLWLIFGFLIAPTEELPQSYDEFINESSEINKDDVAFEINNEPTKGAVWNYYFMAMAENYANSVGKYLEDIDWNKADKNGQTILEKVKFEAMNMAIRNSIMTAHAKEWGISLNEEELNIIDVDLDYFIQLYGDDVYKELNMTDEASFRDIYKSLILERKIKKTVNENIKKYSGDANLSEYATSKSATVKIIGINKDNGQSGIEDPKTILEEYKKRIDGGEKFDTIWLEAYKTATGLEKETPDYECIYIDDTSIDEAIRKTALGLKIGDISDIIETDYAYLIINRVEGYTELENMFFLQSDISINKQLIEDSKVK